MRAQHMVRTAAIVIAFAGTVAGCSALPGGSGKHREEASGPTYLQALSTIRPDAVGALRAAMPNVDLDEEESGDDCGGLDVLDGKDGSKRQGSLDIVATGDPSDKRGSRELVETAVKYLTRRGWTVDARASTTSPGQPGGYVQDLKKPGVPGMISVSAWPYKLTSGKIVQSFGSSVSTDCLRNPNWRKN